jgi:hypothetical protein
MVVAGAPTWKRNSFLKRNPSLTPGSFSRHYETFHGPLAARQAGFRKYALRYVQNHVEPNADGSDPPFDGITMTTQVPRADYNRGFFHEADYENVKSDELFLLDMGRTVSVLGEVVVGTALPRSGSKAVFLPGADWTPPAELLPVGAFSAAVSRLDSGRATALGFGAATFPHAFMVECWFATEADRRDALSRPAALFGSGAIAMAVREILIFGPEKPWSA